MNQFKTMHEGNDMVNESDVRKRRRTVLASLQTPATRMSSVCLGGALVLTGCTFPNRDFSVMPEPAAVIRVVNDGSGVKAVAPDCTAFLTPSRISRPDDPRPAVAFGCATYTNLAGQVANPNDLIAPQPYAGQMADTVQSAVERYREGQVIPLRSTSSTQAGDN